MLTLAQQPYSGISNEDVFNYIGVSRRILTRPTGCPDFWYIIFIFSVRKVNMRKKILMFLFLLIFHL